jgi:hypothetical protein
MCVVAILTTRVAPFTVAECFIGVYLCLAVHTDVVVVLVECPRVYYLFFHDLRLLVLVLGLNGYCHTPTLAVAGIFHITPVII